MGQQRLRVATATQHLHGWHGTTASLHTDSLKSGRGAKLAPSDPNAPNSGYKTGAFKALRSSLGEGFGV